MKYIKKYNNMELIKEARWTEIAVGRMTYDRDDEIREFFLELMDMGGRMISVRNATHAIIDGDFQLKSRIDYVSKPLYKSYMVRMRFETVASAMVHGGVDVHMSKATEFFNEFDDALLKISDFGYKFKIKKFNFDPYKEDGIWFDIVMYNTEDVIPWEYIFAPYED